MDPHHHHHHHHNNHHYTTPHHHHNHHNNHHHHHHNHQSHTIYTTTSNSNSSPYSTTPHMISTPTYPPFQSLDPITSPFSGSDPPGYDTIDPNSHKKKRGRPRKYSPDTSAAAGIDLGLPADAACAVGAGLVTPPQSDSSLKKNRGRPSGSSKKQLDALGNCGVGFTPHVILVDAGEDIASKIVAFSKQGARTVCILSANGTICNVDLRQSAISGGVVKYEGRYEIISLSGSFLFSETDGGQVRTGGLSVSLAGTDGRVLGGGVVGVLRAATPVQIIVGSFIADGKKPKYMPAVTKSSLNFAGPSSHAAAAENSPPSQELSTEGSDDNGSNRNHHMDGNTGSYANSNLPVPGHHNMQMYSQINWSNPNPNPNPGSKMLQH